MLKLALYFCVLVGIWLLVVQALHAQVTAGAERNVSKKCRQFRRLVAGESVDVEATKDGFRTVRSSETHLGNTVVDGCGDTLTVQYGEFSSPDEARRYFAWNLKKASKIVVQDDKLDSKGKHVGLHAEVMGFQTDKKLSGVMWTAGPMFRMILGGSLEDALELEKRYGD